VLLLPFAAAGLRRRSPCASSLSSSPALLAAAGVCAGLPPACRRDLLLLLLWLLPELLVASAATGSPFAAALLPLLGAVEAPCCPLGEQAPLHALRSLLCWQCRCDAAGAADSSCSWCEAGLSAHGAATLVLGQQASGASHMLLLSGGTSAA
jgi:4-amino-4-deoxy-L-arabinose transferase-like glycosyltransferase